MYKSNCKSYACLIPIYRLFSLLLYIDLLLYIQWNDHPVILAAEFEKFIETILFIQRFKCHNYTIS